MCGCVGIWRGRGFTKELLRQKGLKQLLELTLACEKVARSRLRLMITYCPRERDPPLNPQMTLTPHTHTVTTNGGILCGQGH